jgi:hypothetical protein
MPPVVLNDSRGTLILEGAKVAYNRSGEVVLGTIVEVRHNKWIKKTSRNSTHYHWRLKFEMEIKNENGDKSMIKNPNSFVII